LSVLVFMSLVFGTFISEDLACLTAGLLIQRGELSASSGILACTLGIFVGDVGLWGVGRVFGRAALAWPGIAHRLDQERSRELRGLLERHAAAAIVGSRFLPGTRLPLYVIAGLLKLPARVFVRWTLVGTLLWTPIVVLLIASFGDALIAHISPAVGFGWTPTLVTAAALLLPLHVLRVIGSRRSLLGPCESPASQHVAEINDRALARIQN
jgi:membrane protein DedA with SNARE-associated domain